MTHADLLAEIAAEFKRGGIHERHLEADKCHLDGLCEDGKVYVDPAPNVVDTLLHELLHRRFPHWSETYVRRTASQLVHKMTSAEVRRWYRRYRSAAKPAKRPHQADVE